MNPVRPSPIPDRLTDFEPRTFSWKGSGRVVYEQGDGPAVLVMHEVPGITPEVANFARRVAREGYRVSMPVLFGEPGAPFTWPRTFREIGRACVSREFHVFALRQQSPITDWLRALCRNLHERQGGRGVGAIGMCLTGNFALALMVEPALMAPVLSQPSLPFGVSPWHRQDLHIDDQTLAVVKERARAGCPVLGLRFRTDPTVPGSRFQRLQDELGSGFIDVTLDLHHHPRTMAIPHSVVTTELREDLPDHPTNRALAAVLSLFDRQLRSSPESP